MGRHRYPKKPNPDGSRLRNFGVFLCKECRIPGGTLKKDAYGIYRHASCEAHRRQGLAEAAALKASKVFGPEKDA